MWKRGGECITEPRIEFPCPMLMTFNTPLGPNTKFLKKCPKNAGKMKGKIISPPFWFLILKLDHDPGLHAKNQREISKNVVRIPFVWKCGHMPFV